MRWFENESAMLDIVVDSLRRDGWSCYPEIRLGRRRSVDVIAQREGTVWAIEGKLLANFDVLEQANDAIVSRLVDRVSVAVPVARDFFLAVAIRFGLGVMTVSSEYGVTEMVPPRDTPRKNDKITKLLVLEAEYGRSTLRPGKSGGEMMSPFRLTRLKLAAFVRDNVGCTINEAVAAIPHHYSSPSSARSTLRRRIEKGIIPEVVLTGNRLFPALSHVAK